MVKVHRLFAKTNLKIGVYETERDYMIGFVIYGVIFIALGLPLVSGQNSSFILLSVLGAMIETIVIMAIYSLCIKRKYKEQ